MPNPKIIGWIDHGDYEAFKSLCPNDPDLPTGYESWLEVAQEQASAFIKSGIPVEKISISPKEFAAYCKDCGVNPDSAARSAFAVHMVCLRNHNKPG
jgi:hypothetical protein